MRQWQAESARCRTPKQFRALLKRLRHFVPYENFYAEWGYPARSQLCYVLNLGYPLDLVHWRLTTGVIWKSPIFQQWRKTKETFLWCDVAAGMEIDPEFQQRMEQAGAHLSICGGSVSAEHFTFFAASMPSAEVARKYLPTFDEVTPILIAASQRAFPHNLLTAREQAILKRRVHGEAQKLIAANEGISERTVREHLQRIKRKLYTNDLINAVAIAVRQRMV
jgi:DNA-binding CsgD family transcriptional regulator